MSPMIDDGTICGVMRCAMAPMGCALSSSYTGHTFATVMPASGGLFEISDRTSDVDNDIARARCAAESGARAGSPAGCAIALRVAASVGCSVPRESSASDPSVAAATAAAAMTT
jgi:hypothetical protein